MTATLPHLERSLHCLSLQAFGQPPECLVPFGRCCVPARTDDTAGRVNCGSTARVGADRADFVNLAWLFPVQALVRLQIVKNRRVQVVRNGIEGGRGKRLRLVFVRAPGPPVTLIRNGSDCMSVLDCEPHVVEVCGAFSVVDSHNPHTPNTHTIHVAADSAGCRPPGACPGPSASQSASCLSSVRSEGNPTTSAFAADRLSSSTWIHIVHCCLPSPSSAMVCLSRLVLSFLKALRQAMPMQMEMDAPTLPTLSL